jgi:hypothetical protein
VAFTQADPCMVEDIIMREKPFERTYAITLDFLPTYLPTESATMQESPRILLKDTSSTVSAPC